MWVRIELPSAEARNLFGGRTFIEGNVPYTRTMERAATRLYNDALPPGSPRRRLLVSPGGEIPRESSLAIEVRMAGGCSIPNASSSIWANSFSHTEPLPWSPTMRTLSAGQASVGDDGTKPVHLSVGLMSLLAPDSALRRWPM